jgi:hypothetical protein
MYNKAMNNEDDGYSKERIELAKRIETAIDELGSGARSAIARKCGVSKQAITGWIKSGKITFLNMIIVSIETNKSLDYFAGLTGVGSVRENKSDYTAIAKTENEKAALTIARSLPHEVQTIWLADGYKMLQVANATLKTKHQSDEDDKK